MSQIPSILSPYLALPSETSLILLTSVLGASTNWLVLRYLYSYLGQPRSTSRRGFEIGSDGNTIGEEEGDGKTKVLLVSFLRDLAFWKEGARKLGLDFDKLALSKRFLFLDGLSSLYLPEARPLPTNPTSRTLRSADIAGSIRDGIEVLGGGRIVLVIDQLDVLLATNEKVGVTGLGDMVMGLRELVHATILTLSADIPLVTTQQTLLEINSAAFLLSMAHQADLTIGIRTLDTGAARDVSGVLRISIGDNDEDDEEAKEKLLGGEERELLYYVGQDGGVKVFERGQ